MQASGGYLDHPTVNNLERPYRHLTEAQKIALKNLAESLPSDSNFLHIEIVNEPETTTYGNEIASFFRSKSQHIGAGLSYPYGFPEGIDIGVISETDPLFPTMERIAGAFIAAGIPVNVLHYNQPNIIFLRIGVRPEPKPQ